ncbi:DUF1993 domain-containing protein [Ancylobacter terrae]|uniref:DUF1993 domain-containing protein n=1 Tax=Ancylobacter sp. sgz301288 TaxID=3342077 RepID=UPI003859FD13
MSINAHDLTVPVFIRAFANLSAILDKGLAHAQAAGIDPATLVGARLAPDMLTLAGQVQRASDTAKATAGRLIGGDIPAMADTETSFPELQERIGRTVAYLEALDPATFAGALTRPVTLPRRTDPVTMEGQRYILVFALPNFFFHVTTAYDILRHAGVAIGKPDYLGSL